MSTTSSGELAAKLYAAAEGGSTAYSGGPLDLGIDGINSDTVGQTVVFRFTDTETFTLAGAGEDYCLTASNGNLVLHAHSWSKDWESASTAHWHECTASGCPITDDTQKYDYETHSAPADDGDCTTAVTCATCGHVFMAAQTHSYTYTAQDNIITETCSNEGCTAHTETAAITAPAGTLTYDGTTAFHASVSYSDGWAGGKELTISYTKGGAPVTDTKGAGSYIASITMDGKTAQVSYTVNKAEVDVPTISSKEYSGSNQTADISDTSLYTVKENNGGMNFGEYDVVLELKDSDNYKWKTADTKEITLKFSITADTNEWTTTPDIGSWTYGETAKESTGAAKYGTTIFTYYDSDETMLPEKPSNAGSYYMKATVAADGNNYAEIQTDYIPFTIHPKEIVIEWAEDDFTYNGADQKEKVTASYKDISGNSVRLTTSTTGEFKDYKEEGYTFTASFANDETNYKLPDESTKTYHMKKATPVFTFPTAGEVTYGDTLATSTLSGETGNGTFAWADETTIPTVTNSDYEMIFTPNDTDNYDYTNVEGYNGDTKEVTRTVAIVVNPRPVNISWTGTENLVYDGTKKTISAQVANLVEGDVVSLTLDGTVTATEKGEYTASVTALDNENYTINGGQNLTKQWAIAEGTNEFTTPLSITGWTYGQAPNAPTVVAKFGNPVFTYSDAENGAYSEIVPTAADDYWVKATVPGTVSYAEISMTVPFKIFQAQPVVPETPAPAAVTYDPFATLAGITLPDGWEWADSTIVPVVNNEGYTAYYAVDDSNYNWTGADGYDAENHRLERTIALTVNPAKPAYTEPDNLTAVYGQTLADVTLPTGFTWQDATATSVGNYGNNRFLVTYRPNDTSNYQIVADIEVTIAVTQATPVVTLSTQNPQGVGEARSVDLVAAVTGVTGGEIPAGTVEYFAGTESLGSATLADGTATFTWNHIPVGGHSLRAVYSGSTNYTTAEDTTSYNLDKDTQAELVISGVPEEVVYGSKPFTLTVTGGSGTGGVTYAVTRGDSVSVDADGNVTILKAGESVITVTKAADGDYNEASAAVTITVSQAAPLLAEGEEVTAQRVRRGNLLSTSEITGIINGIDGQPLEGTWTWRNDREMDEAGTFEETVVFTPTDTNYAPFETTVSVTVYRPSSGGSSVTRYTVTFDTQGGSGIDSVRVNRNATVAEPAVPTREGYTFEGWFTDEDCTEAYDFSTRVTKNMTLYAKWAQEQPTEPTDPDEPEIPTEWENPYSDVAESDWFYDAVKYADENGLFSGITETTFAPNTAITRGMLVTVLWRAENQPVVNYLMTFDDVDTSAYYGEAVRWAASEGLVKGYSDEEFASDKPISREEMAAIINRYADYKVLKLDTEGNLSKFTDEDMVSAWAKENVEWAVGNEILSGKGNGILDPQGNTTRAETAAILQRLNNGSAPDFV